MRAFTSTRISPLLRQSVLTSLLAVLRSYVLLAQSGNTLKLRTMKKSAHSYLAMLVIAVVSLTTITPAYADTEFDSVASFGLSKKISEPLKAYGFSGQALDGSSSNFTAVGLSVKDQSLTYQFELANLYTESTETRPDPKDRRVRFAVSHKKEFNDVSLHTKLRAEYRFMDETRENHWRIRPGIGVSTKFHLGGHEFQPKANFETLYSLEQDEVDMYLVNAGVSYNLTDSISISPGYLYIILPDRDDSDFITVALQVSLD